VVRPGLDRGRLSDRKGGCSAQFSATAVPSWSEQCDAWSFTVPTPPAWRWQSWASHRELQCLFPCCASPPGEPAVGWTAWWLQGSSSGDVAEGVCSGDSSSCVDSRSGSICAPPAALVVPLAATTADAAAALFGTGPVSVDGSSSSSVEECPSYVSAGQSSTSSSSKASTTSSSESSSGVEALLDFDSMESDECDESENKFRNEGIPV
jgi:hypothetical protein